jgi:integrase
MAEHAARMVALAERAGSCPAGVTVRCATGCIIELARVACAPECQVTKLGGKMRKSLIRHMRNGLQSGLRRFDVAADLKDAFAPVASRNFASVTDPVNVGELLRAIDGYSGQLITALALKLAPVVFVRPGELRAAEWSEFDFDNSQWRIPGARMNN